MLDHLMAWQSDGSIVECSKAWVALASWGGSLKWAYRRCLFCLCIVEVSRSWPFCSTDDESAGWHTRRPVCCLLVMNEIS
ncbi:hypothetical protein N657DRAFT_74237 [Parathielavia appendiculata]|uniref:Uncharacterized protein n=1 Tax=Parathielavia appendiculata TaxID=2587402 RepID=A0AAN6UAF6_9PEZI|nr:hypothetical protein N657DRAFT_74237 [Parathielavia appendiculata]